MSANSGVSTVRLQIDGTGSSIPTQPNGFGATSGIGGSLDAFNYLSRTLVSSMIFQGVQGSLSSSGDIQLGASGNAMVNGVSTNVVVSATKKAGAVTCEIRNANTGQLLAGGNGETGRANFVLTVM